MSEPMEPTAVHPALSTEQKLRVRNIQFSLTRTREHAARLVSDAEKSLMSALGELATELKIDPNTANFDLDTLKFSAKP
jgi:hypothetical protein